MGVDDGGPSGDSGASEGSDGLSARLNERLSRTRATLSGLLGSERRPVEERRDMDAVESFTPPPLPDSVEGHRTRGEVLGDVVDHFESADLAFDRQPDAEAVRKRFFDFSYLADHEEVERYWVNEPYAYVTIVRDLRADELRYRVVEPYLSEFERYVLEELTKHLRNSLMYYDVADGSDRASLFERKAADLVREHTAAVTTLSLYKLLYYLRRDFVEYGRIDPIMHDEAVEDISCDGTDLPVFVYHREYRDLDTNVSFDGQELNSFVARMAQRAGKHISVSNPLVDASLPDGSRIQLSFGGDIATRGANFTIRQFSAVPDTPVDLINWDTFSLDQMAYLWLCIENNRSLVFAGGTGSGKTTSLNAVSFFIPKKSKVVSIEDTPEVKLPHENWIQSLTRESVTASGEGSVTMYQQLQTALRQRPEYILVGEIRTESEVALTFFQAMATGHTAYTTVHSESVTGVINRLENEPLSVPTQMIKELDIVSIQKQVMLDGERVRRNDSITEIVDGGGGTQDILVDTVFEWDAESDSHNDFVDSSVFDDIAEDRGWTDRRIREEFRDRREVLAYLVENDITWHEDVARVIHGFMKSPDRVLERVRDDTLDPTSLTLAPAPTHERAAPPDTAAPADPDGDGEELEDLVPAVREIDPLLDEDGEPFPDATAAVRERDDGDGGDP
ncbi:type II/IV secretion system ATPase subunit [Halosegnis marinus]|uniref:Type II/IV secretion system ATPase subunit n=1 Tax=Halosegnis marinus TaxID=3034023 RepID=A0ABD5ZPU7_9EURY|nr:type II/IV secretion system ATPase subunit [Halosegnis sp. DT85]